MLRIVLFAVAAGTILLVSGCEKKPEPVKINDALGVGKPLSAALKSKFAMYVTTNSKVESTQDFLNCALVLLWDTEGHLDMKITMLEMEKTHDFLFREVVFIDSIQDDELNTSTENAPYEVDKDTLESVEDQLLPRVRTTYNKIDINKIFERYLDCDDCVFVASRSYAKQYASRLKELVIK